MRRVLAGIVSTVLALVLAHEATAETRVALVIGNSAYRHAPELANPVNDARSVSDALERLGFEVVFGLDLAREGMEATIRTFARRLEAADVGLFYYAGHGLQVNGRNYLIPVDARLESELDLRFEATDLMFVLGLMERAASTTLAFLDACRDNPLARNLARSMGATRSTTIGRGLARVETGVGTLIVYATAPGQVALDGEGAHSPFTNALLEHLPEGGLEVRQMLSRVRQTVLEDTNGFQVPWDHSSLVGDFYFTPPQTAAAPGVAPPPAAPAFDARALELAFWQSIKDSGDWRDFQAYLDQFGADGTFGGLARVRRDRLRDEGAPAQQAPVAPSPPTARNDMGGRLLPGAAEPESSPRPSPAQTAARHPYDGKWTGRLVLPRLIPARDVVLLVDGGQIRMGRAPYHRGFRIGGAVDPDGSLRDAWLSTKDRQRAGILSSICRATSRRSEFRAPGRTREAR